MNDQEAELVKGFGLTEDAAAELIKEYGRDKVLEGAEYVNKLRPKPRNRTAAFMSMLKQSATESMSSDRIINGRQVSLKMLMEICSTIAGQFIYQNQLVANERTINPILEKIEEFNRKIGEKDAEKEALMQIQKEKDEQIKKLTEELDAVVKQVKFLTEKNLTPHQQKVNDMLKEGLTRAEAEAVLDESPVSNNGERGEGGVSGGQIDKLMCDKFDELSANQQLMYNAIEEVKIKLQEVTAEKRSEVAEKVDGELAEKRPGVASEGGVKGGRMNITLIMTKILTALMIVLAGKLIKNFFFGDYDNIAILRHIKYKMFEVMLETKTAWMFELIIPYSTYLAGLIVIVTFGIKLIAGIRKRQTENQSDVKEEDEKKDEEKLCGK